MADSCESYSRFLNPCRFHLQKMELELKCAVCLDLLNQPVLLPCNHVFCSSCIPSTVELGVSCTVCKLPYLHRDLRPAQHIENMPSICKSMCAAFANLSDSLASHNMGICDKSRGKTIQNIHTENSRHVRVSLPSFPTSKRVQASFDLNISEVDLPEKPVQSSHIRGCRGNGEYVSSDSQNSTHGANKETSVDEENSFLPPFFWSSDPPCQSGAEEGYVDQLLQKLPIASSFDNSNGSDDGSNDKRSEKCTKRLPTKVVGKKEPKYGTNLEARTISQCSADMDSSIDKRKASGECKVNMNRRANSSVDEDSIREPKRRKDSTFGLHDMSSSTMFHMNENPSQVCAFCQSFKESEATGPMMHYIDGRAVLVDQATHSEVLHAHERCIEWAPQVYFVGETAVNLEAEVERGKKIKCSICAKRGAALGCSAKSCRRSFHVPCAVEILDCQWDHDNFSMFCPMHSSFKLRNGRSKSRKKKRARHSSVTQIASPKTLVSTPSNTAQEANEPWIASPDVTMGWVLCGSALSTAEKDLMTDFARLIGATITKEWKPSVTHVIASTNNMGACSRTLKFLMAILGGKWILKVDWVKACMVAKSPVHEELYEFGCDVHGRCNGPKNGQMRILEKEKNCWQPSDRFIDRSAPKLFSSMNIYFFGDFVPSYKGYLKDLVIAAGGTVQVKEDMVSHDSFNGKATPAMSVVIYNQDNPPHESCNPSQLSSATEQRHGGEAEAFAAKTGSQVVGHTWLLESIAACRLQPWST